MLPRRPAPRADRCVTFPPRVAVLGRGGGWGPGTGVRLKSRKVYAGLRRNVESAAQGTRARQSAQYPYFPFAR